MMVVHIRGGDETGMDDVGTNTTPYHMYVV